MNLVVGILAGIYLSVGVITYIVVVNVPGASGNNKLFAAAAAAVWPLAIVWTFLFDRWNLLDVLIYGGAVVLTVGIIVWGLLWWIGVLR
jgi:hypothetical protein